MYRLRRWLRGSLATLLLVALFLLLSHAPSGEQWQSKDGAIRVSDGDSFARNGVRYRLSAIDAPETGQHCQKADGTPWDCGRQAREFLASLVNRADVRCVQLGNDRYGRTLVTCQTEQYADIGAEMIRAGLAITYGKDAIGSYGLIEIGARIAGRGIWQGQFTRPADWRRERENRP